KDASVAALAAIWRKRRRAVRIGMLRGCLLPLLKGADANTITNLLCAPAAGIIAAAMRWGLRHIPLAALCRMIYQFLRVVERQFRLLTGATTSGIGRFA